MFKNWCRELICGGSLISPNFVLTAAHCTENLTANQLMISVGDANFQMGGDGETFITVESITPHPMYNSTNDDIDFCLLKLSTPAQISSIVGIVCLPPNTAETFVGQQMIASGWGHTKNNGTKSPDLLYTSLIVISNSDCKKTTEGIISANMICAIGDNYSTDTCQEDSGGPMVASVNNKVTLVGVTSFGTAGCAEADKPGVYARVTAQKSWILENSDAGSCQN